MGTSSAVPTKDRGLSSVAVLRGSELLLFDAGEGTQRATIKAGLGLNRRMKAFITHLHGDHCVGLLGLLQTMALTQRTRPIDVYGPKGLEGFLKHNIRCLKFGLTYPLRVHSVKEGVVVREADYLVKACPSEHSIPTYAYSLEEFERPGVFDPEKAISLGVPKGRLWSELQRGSYVVVGGRRVEPGQVLGPKRPGRKIGISGDTRPTLSLVKFFSGTDVLIFDSTYGDDQAEKAAENLHSTAREAALLAKEAKVKLLILTHFSARYEDADRLVAQASEVHPNVIAASDFMEVEVPYPDSGQRLGKQPP